MNLHIVGGRHKGRPLKSPKGDSTRPTTSMLRKAVFDIVRPMIDDAHFLDLFAGSGAMGLEALSQGAKSATFIENNKSALVALRENICSLGFEKQSSIIPKDVQTALYRLHGSFDIVYADPPYELAEMHYRIISFFDASPLLKAGGIVFLEEGTPSKLELQGLSLQSLVCKETRQFGKSLLHRFYKPPHSKANTVIKLII